MSTRLTPRLIGFVISIVLVLGLVMPAAGAGPRPDRGTVAVHHGHADVTLTDPTSDGHQLGDLRVTSVETSAADGSPLGRLEATLTTTAIDEPVDGDEVRIGTLVFSFGDDGVDQVVVEGVAHYPGAGATIASGDVTVRPIVGGSGRFSGVRGSAVSEHLADGSWVHTLRMAASMADVALERAFRLRLREGIRDWREQRRESVAQRDAGREQRRSAREQRRAARHENRIDRGGRGTDAGSAAIDEIYTDAAPDDSGVVRTDLGIADPDTAPGEELGLWHYSIPAGQELAPHTHPGWQLARVTAGELEYSVISGEGTLLRADGSSEPMGPGTYLLATGDGVIENPDLVHFGANRGDEVVSIISASLFAAGEPVAKLVDETAVASPTP